METSKAVSKTRLRRAERYSWRLILTTAGSVLGAIVPNLVGAGPTATLVGAILVALLSAIFTGEGPATRAKALAALGLTLIAVVLTVSGFTLADLVRGRSVLGDREYTFPVPSLPKIEERAVSTPRSSSFSTPSSNPDPTLPLNPNPRPSANLHLPPNPAPLTPLTTRAPRSDSWTPAPTAKTPLPTTVTPSSSPPGISSSDEEVLEEAPVELKADPGQESVEIDWWRKVSDGSGDLQMSPDGIFTVLGAKLSIIEDAPTATRARCAQVQTWTAQISFASMHVDSQLCAQSRGSRYASLKVTALPSSYASKQRFIFYGKTWAVRFTP